MAKLKARRRNALPASAFVYRKQRKYPIDTLRRARNALTRARQSNTFGSYSTVAKAVKRRWGSKVASVGGPRGTTSRPGYKRGTQNRRRKTR